MPKVKLEPVMTPLKQIIDSTVSDDLRREYNSLYRVPVSVEGDGAYRVHCGGGLVFLAYTIDELPEEMRWNLNCIFATESPPRWDFDMPTEEYHLYEPAVDPNGTDRRLIGWRVTRKLYMVMTPESELIELNRKYRG